MLELLWRLHWNAWKAYEFPGIHARLKELREEAALSRQAWLGLQRERLVRTLDHASQHVDHYREIFARADFRPTAATLPEGLSLVPLLTKGTIRSQGERLIASTAKRARLLRNATGGSTGVPLSFYQDEFYLATSMALTVHVPQWWGIHPHDPTASVWGADQEVSELTRRERFYLWKSRVRTLNAFRMSERDIEDFVRMLLRWRPPYMKGYASALVALAKHASVQARGAPRFVAISSSAETLFPAQRRMIEATFQTPVYDSYGSREVSNLAAECPEEKRLHLVSTWRHVETVDEQGLPVAVGQPGYVAVTDLSNYSMPFIRYLNGDVAQLDPRPCPCGRPMPVLDRLLGRSCDLIRSPAGDIVHGEFFTHLFYGLDEVLRFQVHQLTKRHLVVRYVSATARPVESMNEVVRKIRQRMGDDVEIEVQRCEEIPLPPSGKHRFTISEVDDLRNLATLAAS